MEEKELTKNERETVRKLEALPIKWDNAYGISPRTMVEAKVAQAFLRGESVVMTCRPRVGGRAVGDPVMLSVKAADGALGVSRTSYSQMLAALPVKWDEYAQFGVTPDLILATGKARDFIAGRDILMQVDIAGEKSDKVLTYVKGESPYINMDTPFAEKERARVWYGPGERDSYDIFDNTREDLLAGKVVLITPNKVTKDRPEVLCELSSAGRLRYKRVDCLREAVSNTSLGSLMTPKMLDAYVHGEDVKPKGWKSEIHYSPAEGGFAYARREKAEVQTRQEAPAREQNEERSEQRSHGRGR